MQRERLGIPGDFVCNLCHQTTLRPFYKYEWTLKSLTIDTERQKAYQPKAHETGRGVRNQLTTPVS